MSKQEKNNQTKNSFVNVIKSLSKSFDNIHNEINSHPCISNTLSVVRFRQFDIEKKLCDLENRVSGLEIINTNNQNDIFLLSERLSALDQGYKVAQPQENIKPVELPQDVQDFINRVGVLTCDDISCHNCIFNRDKGECLLSVSYYLRHKYVVKD